jgi:hypothetical protein
MCVNVPTSVNPSVSTGGEDLMDEFQRGRLSLAVEVVRQIELFRGATGNSLLALEKEEIISVLETFLKINGLWDSANEAYREQIVGQTTLAFRAESAELGRGGGEP